MSKKLTIMSGLALRGAMDAVIVPKFEKETGIKVEIRWDPTTVVMQAITDGARSDIVILTDQATAELEQKGIVIPDSKARLAQAVLGLGVLKGAPRADISTTEAFKQAVVNARSVAFSRGGASGIYFDKLIEKLGVAEPVRQKATVIPAGFTAEQLVNGKADIAVQQISELLVVPGVDIVGPFPPELQSPTPFTASIMTDSTQADDAARLIQAMLTPEAMKAQEDSGLMLR